MTDRERLIYLIGKVQDEGADYSGTFMETESPASVENYELADYLLANGVTFKSTSMAKCKDSIPCWEDKVCRYKGECVNKVITNSDRIRKMTDEELATLVRAVIKVEDCPSTKGSDCDTCFFRRLCPVGYKYVGCELEWLQKPVEE